MTGTSAEPGGGRSIGIFGGAFAPFHNGHLRLAIEAREKLELSEVRLIPTALPPHRRSSTVPPPRRLEWVKLAVRKEPGLVADDCEIRREGPSYTVDTLTALHERHPEDSLVLIMGADAFMHLHCWHRWEELIGLAHIAVATRAGAVPEASPETAQLLAPRRARSLDEFHAQRVGLWMPVDLPMLDISSTRIRRRLKAGLSVRGLVPDAILSALTAADIAALTRDDDATTH